MFLVFVYVCENANDILNNVVCIMLIIVCTHLTIYLIRRMRKPTADKIDHISSVQSCQNEYSFFLKTRNVYNIGN